MSCSVSLGFRRLCDFDIRRHRTRAARAACYDRVVNRSWTAVACLLLSSASCTSGARAPDLPFDARPVMRAMLQDTRSIAEVLAHGSLPNAVIPARRIASVPIATVPGEAGIDPAFWAAEVNLKRAARELLGDLEIGDRVAARHSFDRVLANCAACHGIYRPGGVAGLPGRSIRP